MRNLKTWITILLTSIALSTLGQNSILKELGVGFVIPINPYEFEDLSTPVNLFKDKALTEKRDSNNVFPFFFKPDYGLYHFICLDKGKDYFKILANDTEVAYVPNDGTYFFKTWKAILLESTVERVTDDNPILEEIGDQDKTIDNSCEFDRLTVKDVHQKDGQYWLQIYFSSNCEGYPDESGPNIKHGWIKWRVKNNLLVNILLLC